MTSNTRYAVGRLYYYCGITPGTRPVPSVQPFVLDRIDDDAYVFITPEELNARDALRRLDASERDVVLEMLDESRGLVLPLDSETRLLEPAAAIEFLRTALSDGRLQQLV